MRSQQEPSQGNSDPRLPANRTEHLVQAPSGESICCTVDRPSGSPRGVVIFSHALPGNRTGPQRLLTGLAEQLAARGWQTVRFDYRGSGDSDGEFEATTFAAMQSDLGCILDWVADRHPGLPVFGLGLSIGGVMVARSAAQGEIAGVALLSSDLIEGITFTTAGHADEDGMMSVRGGDFRLPEEFWRERERLWPFSGLANLGAEAPPVLYVYGTQDAMCRHAARRFRAAGFRVHGIQCAGHYFESEAARRRLARRLLSWVAAAAAAR